MPKYVKTFDEYFVNEERKSNVVYRDIPNKKKTAIEKHIAELSNSKDNLFFTNLVKDITKCEAESKKLLETAKAKKEVVGKFVDTIFNETDHLETCLVQFTDMAFNTLVKCVNEGNKIDVEGEVRINKNTSGEKFDKEGCMKLLKNAFSLQFPEAIDVCYGIIDEAVKQSTTYTTGPGAKTYLSGDDSNESVVAEGLMNVIKKVTGHLKQLFNKLFGVRKELDDNLKELKTKLK